MRISDWSSDVCSSDLGYDYSSSIYPILHDHYGMPDASRFRFRPSDRHALVEVPISTLRLRGRNLPSGGGGRSEEHTSELQSLMRISYAVFCLKKKKKNNNKDNTKPK